MKDGNVYKFIDKTTFEECAVIYNGKKYFFHGLIFDGVKSEYSYMVDIWDASNHYERTVFDKTAPTAEACLELAQNEPIFDGKTFWEAEKDMVWVEW